MTTRPYSECLAQALALCGVPDANATEVARVKIFINRRAKQAYAESEIWPRWLVVGEERIVSEDGLLPYSQSSLRDIGTIQRIHESRPFLNDPAGEYVDWTSQNDGVQITRFTKPANQGIRVSGALSPDASGDYLSVGNEFAGEDTGKPVYRFGSTDDSSDVQYPTGLILWNNTVWQLLWATSETEVSLWNSFEDVATPDLVTTWSPVVSAVGDPDVEAADLYSAFVTYKAAMPTAYGDSESEEDEVPEEWFEWMATGAAASFLFSDKETEPAIVLEAQARGDLDAQLDKVTRQNGNKVATRILTHGGMQAR